MLIIVSQLVPCLGERVQDRGRKKRKESWIRYKLKSDSIYFPIVLA